MRLYLKGLKTNRHMFGWSRNFLFFCGVVLVFLVSDAVNAFLRMLDHLFFPGFKKVEVKRPVFIIGHPRSGTTFIHKLFTQTDEMAAPCGGAPRLFRDG